jgi:hypothetical protein
MQGVISHVNSDSIIGKAATIPGKFSFIRLSHDVIKGHHPIWLGSTYTIPQRLTVAGDATAKSWTWVMM